MSTFYPRISRKYLAISLAVLGAILLTTFTMWSTTWAATNVTFEDVPFPTLPPFGDTTSGAPLGCITRTMTVATDISITQVNFGLTISHTYRGDLTATLKSPAGTVVRLMNADASDNRDNYDITFTDGGGLLDNGTNDDINSPFYERSVAPVDPLNQFNGESGAGTWILTVCDNTDPNAAFYHRSELLLTGTIAGYNVYLPVLIQSNAPKKWTAQTSGVATDLNGVSCPSTTTCFAVGNSGVIRATTNGGTSWNGQTSGTAQNLNDISCPTTSTCFAAGDNGVILETVNGGAAWSAQSSGTAEPLRGISCPTATFCLAVGGANKSTTVTTSNGGSSWKASSALSPNTSTFGVSCPTSSLCLIVGNFGRIYAVTSQPALIYKLTLFDVPNSRSLRGVSCPAGSLTCFAVGEGGKLVASTNINSSSSWAEQNSTTTNFLQDVSCGSTSTCNAVGASGTIQATQNGGSTWASEASGTTVALNDVSCPDTNTCWAVGANGTVLKGQ